MAVRCREDEASRGRVLRSRISAASSGCTIARLGQGPVDACDIGRDASLRLKPRILELLRLHTRVRLPCGIGTLPCCARAVRAIRGVRDPPGSMNRLSVLADTMILDQLVEDEETLRLVEELSGRGMLDLVVTTVTERQVADIKNEVKRERLRAIPRRAVGTVGFIVGYSLVGVDRLGPSGPIEAIRTGRLKETQDALIAATADFDELPLVTEDVRLRRKAECDLGLQVWSWRRFAEEIHALAARVSS